MSGFLVEDQRIFSMLDSVDIMKLWGLTCLVRSRANVNRYLNRLIHQDSVWQRLFREDNSRNLTIVLQNEWLREEWKKVYPDMPIPNSSVC